MQPILHRTSSRTLAGIFFLLSFAATPFACAASGLISSPDQYAWGNIAGWINFAPVDSTVTVSDSSLTGYAWSENDGWINLSPTEGGVTNSDGTLGGWAWDQSAGWVSFSGVTIDTSGTFHGEATGSNGYAINFDCSTCDVVTDWRAATQNIATPTKSSSGAVSPVAPASYATPSVTAPPVPPPSESVPGAYPSTPHDTSRRGGLVGSKPSIGSTITRAAGRSSIPPPGTTAKASGRLLWRIVLSAVGLSLIAILAAVFQLVLQDRP